MGARFLEEWNRAAITRNDPVVITPYGDITAETQAQIEIARAAGREVRYVCRVGHTPKPYATHT